MNRLLPNEESLDSKTQIAVPMKSLIPVMLIIVIDSEGQNFVRDIERQLRVIVQREANDDVVTEYVKVRVAVLSRFRAASFQFREGEVLIAENETGKGMKLEVQIDSKAPFPEWFIERRPSA